MGVSAGAEPCGDAEKKIYICVMFNVGRLSFQIIFEVITEPSTDESLQRL